MLSAETSAALAGARVARLATADAEGRPHAVPICFAMLAGEPPTLVTPIDEKPKAGEAGDLRRVSDVRANPRAAVVVDRYDEDWNRLGWVQLRGTATLLDPGEARHGEAVEALRARYDQYRTHDLEARPVIAIEVGSSSTWGDLGMLTSG